ncbi:MAG: hypothetical protein AAFR77_05145 [Cyanobacteria bacterium J06631_2]
MIDKTALRVSAQEMQDIITLASQLYAKYDSTISVRELLAAGQGANIPSQFIIAAYQEVLTWRRQPKKPKINRKTILLIAMTSILAIKFNILGSKKPPTAVTANNQAVVPRKLYVQSTQSDTDDYFKDGNVVRKIAVYRTGNAGHVTQILCIFPPDINIDTVKSITRDKTAVDYVYFFCSPVE